MSPATHKRIFTLSAVFNWLVGLGLFFAANPLLDLFHVTPLPTETTFLRLFAVLVIALEPPVGLANLHGPEVHVPGANLVFVGALGVDGSEATQADQEG